MSLSAYWPILRKRQVQVVIVASVVAGLRIGLPLALILLVEEQAGDFASAGAVAGAFTLASALSGPPKGRVIDRRGQPRVLMPLAISSALSLVALVAVARSDASVVALVALATLAGITTAPLFPSMRTLWPDLVDDVSQLETAYSIQAIVGEIFYISGPLVAGVLLAVGTPTAAVLALTGIELAGVLAFAATPTSRRWRGEPREVGWTGALASPGIRTLTAISLPFGATFGLLDVAIPAFAESRGDEAAAGVIFAAFAVGSMLGGVVYGARSWGDSDPGFRLAVFIAALAVLVVPLALAETNLALTLLAGVAGTTVAPAVTVEYRLLDDVAPTGTATEAMSWIVTAYGTGVAIGAACSGPLADGPGTDTAFLAAAACCGVAALIPLARRRSLRADAALRALPAESPG